MNQIIPGKSGSTWKVLLVAGVIALILGGAIAYYYRPIPLPPPQQVAQTDAHLQAVPEAIRESIRRVEELTDRVRREVSGIRATSKKEVAALPPDGVADGLNDELASFRGVAVRAGRMDNP